MADVRFSLCFSHLHAAVWKKKEKQRGQVPRHFHKNKRKRLENITHWSNLIIAKTKTKYK